MASQSYLIFSLRNIRYSIEALLVKEVFSLPELIPIPETPTDIVGLLNLRGAYIPVMHLDKRLGHPLQPFQLSDSIVVVESQGLQVGMIVQTVQEVREIDTPQIRQEIDYGRVSDINTAFVKGVAQIEDETIVLLNSETLIRQPENVASLLVAGTQIATAQSEADQDDVFGSGDIFGSDTELFLEPQPDQLPDEPAQDLWGEVEADQDQMPAEQLEPTEQATPPPRITTGFYDLYCPSATPKERELFRVRAENLRQAIALSSEVTGLTPFAVIGLGGEYFGVDVRCVQEFTEIRNLTSIPCCPSHIVGNMNLRGEIVTLVDIRSVLNLSVAPVKVGSQTMVVQVGDVVAGLAVDEVQEVVYLHPSAITEVPIALPPLGHSSLRGTAPYANTRLSVLDLPKLLNGDELVVNEAV